VNHANLPPRTRLPVLLAACVGNGFEFYNVTIYAFVAVTLSRLFFPAGRFNGSMLLTFGLFGVSYIVRPLGGLLLGAYADRAGRRASLLLSISLMLAGTVLLVFSPTYQTIGIWAPLSLLCARLLQGLALGGEFGSTAAYLLENAPPQKQSLYASLQFASQGLGALLTALVMFTVSRLSSAQMVAWGWRVPFAVGLLLAPIGLYLRSNMRDTEAFLHTRPVRHPIQDLLRHHGKRIAVAAASTAVLSANIYLRVYLPTFAQTRLGIPIASSALLMLITAVSTMVLVPFSANLVTPRNALRWMSAVIVTTLVAIWPLLHMLDVYRSRVALIVAYTLLTVLSALYSAPQAWFVSMLFPTHVRASGVGASFNFGVLLFGGFAPAIYAALASSTATIASSAVYVAFAGCVSLISIAVTPKRLWAAQV
jgi:MHS family proline/betaine transporter-like MFS transporter